MKKSTLYILCTYSLLLLIGSASYAQEPTFSLKSPTNTINIDGDSKDWGDSLAYFNAEKKLHYALANDKTNLYLVIKTNDPTQQACIVASGVTFAIDTKGRKKSTYVTTFPINATEINIQPDNTIEEKRLKTELTDLKKIGIDGFKDIRDDEINF